MVSVISNSIGTRLHNNLPNCHKLYDYLYSFKKEWKMSLVDKYVFSLKGNFPFVLLLLVEITDINYVYFSLFYFSLYCIYNDILLTTLTLPIQLQ